MVEAPGAGHLGGGGRRPTAGHNDEASSPNVLASEREQNANRANPSSERSTLRRSHRLCNHLDGLRLLREWRVRASSETKVKPHDRRRGTDSIKAEGRTGQGNAGAGGRGRR